MSRCAELMRALDLPVRHGYPRRTDELPTGPIGGPHRHRHDGEPRAGRRPRDGAGAPVRRPATPAMDAFNVAFRVPNLLRDLFAEGAMTAAFVPTFTRTLRRAAARRPGASATWSSTRCSSVTGRIWSCSASLVRRARSPAHMASGAEFAGVPGKLELTTQLTRMMLPFLTTVAVAVAVMGMLNSLHRFFIPALSPAMFNVATIAARVPARPADAADRSAADRRRSRSAPCSAASAQIAVQWPALRKEGFRYRPIARLPRSRAARDPALMGPGTLGLAAVQINVLVNTSLATTQPQGAVSWLNYAFRLMYLPIGLFGVSIATAALPDIVAARGRRRSRRRCGGRSRRGLRLMLMLNVPATIGLIVLAHPIVELLLERGRFTSHDTAATAAALMFYAPGLLGYSAVKIASPSFYSLRDSRTPVDRQRHRASASTWSSTSCWCASWASAGSRSARPSPRSSTPASLLWLLGRRLDGLDGRRIAVAFAKILVASILMGAASCFAAAVARRRCCRRGSGIWRAVRVSSCDRRRRARAHGSRAAARASPNSTTPLSRVTAAVWARR